MKHFFLTLVFAAMLGVSALGLLPRPVHATSLFESILNAGLAEVGNDAYQTDGYSPKSVSEIIADIVRLALGALGIIFVALIVYAGFLWMGAGGNSDQAGKARGLILNAAIGLLIVLSAYSITYFLFKNVLTATQGTTNTYQPDVDI